MDSVIPSLGLWGQPWAPSWRKQVCEAAVDAAVADTLLLRRLGLPEDALTEALVQAGKALADPRLDAAGAASLAAGIGGKVLRLNATICPAVIPAGPDSVGALLERHRELLAGAPMPVFPLSDQAVAAARMMGACILFGTLAEKLETVASGVAQA